MGISEKQLLEEINNKLERLIAIILAKTGLSRKEVAKVLGVSEKTVERMVPFRKIKK
jgi:transposase